jgi:uncharacterized membrane protein YoaK (UPF0700 family)
MDQSSSPERHRRRAPVFQWLTVAFAALFVLTAIVPDWLEVLGLEGIDNGNGGAEGVVLVALGVVTIVCGVFTYTAYQRRATNTARVRTR